MKTVKIQAEIPAYLRDALTQLPANAGKSESDIVADALRYYVDGQVPRLRELQECLGWRAADRGDVASEGEVAAVFQRYGA